MTYKKRKITNFKKFVIKLLLHIIFNTQYPCENSKPPYKQETAVYNLFFIARREMKREGKTYSHAGSTSLFQIPCRFAT